MMSCPGPSQVAFVNNKVHVLVAVQGSPLNGKEAGLDPSDVLIEVHLAALKWNMQQRWF